MNWGLSIGMGLGLDFHAQVFCLRFWKVSDDNIFKMILVHTNPQKEVKMLYARPLAMSLCKETTSLRTYAFFYSA